MIEGIFEELKLDINNIYDEAISGYSISEKVRDNALSFIKLMSIRGLNLIEDIYPNPNETISISFKSGELEIGENTMSYFISKSPIIYGNNKEINIDEVNIFNDYILENYEKN
jgi:hypothetical protein